MRERVVDSLLAYGAALTHAVHSVSAFGDRLLGKTPGSRRASPATTARSGRAGAAPARPGSGT